MFGIARNVAFSFKRIRAREAIATDSAVIEESNSHTDDPLAVAPIEQKRHRLRRALLRLNDRERDALALSYVHGLSSAEAAAILECDAGNYRTRVSRARTRLTQLLETSQ